MQKESGHTHLKTDQICQFQRCLTELSEELDGWSTDFDKIVSLLESVSSLKRIQNFSQIGKESEEWESKVRKGKEEGSFYSLALSREKQGELSEDVQNWIYNYKSELDDIVAITSSADLPTEKLWQGPDAFLDVNLGEGYNSERQDLREACKNLLCGTYTSSELMSLRTLESLLRKWYKDVKGENPGNKKWHDVFGALEASEDVEEFQEMEYLDLLRERRNKVAHPDVHSTRREAELTLQRTFNLVEKVISIIEANDMSTS